MDDVAATCCPSVRLPRGGLVVAAPDVVGYHATSLAVLWPAIAARAGVALDHRGTRRLTEFTTRSRPGAVMPLSGGWEVVRGAGEFALRRVLPAVPGPTSLPLAGALRWGRWCFVADGHAPADDPWSAVLPVAPLVVRAWRNVDRVQERAGRVRVKRLLHEAGIPASERDGWPVVVAGEAIVWIPGVSRARAATARSGRPGVSFRCEPSDG
jgi:tRNA(Ile)-lysidine synthetase-like protein